MYVGSRTGKIWTKEMRKQHKPRQDSSKAEALSVGGKEDTSGTAGHGLNR